ncbi:MAG TPA: hypothetical protein PKE35_01170 [Anaerolineales bacterium]|nr:hypothetical protein [Anaerolineales bacterium]HMV94845.1 hypothetical protein [Anaerolineales bacterium]HMX17853.1 hypothetical protein [Anaerolineales bacterium]HMX72827.1 hypothetical protein [Anaerolineales bacterium]HMZ43264.1 hypothetical protein [Anaerolineales bacterium]
MNIPNVNHYIHAYKIAPWRVQRQWIGNALLMVVALAMISTLYLDVTSQAAIAGREIQDLTSSIIVSQQVSGDLQTHLASLTSASVMRQRALELGFRPMEAEEVEYLVVPGYVTLEPDILSSAPLPQLSALTFPPEYNQSLLDWMDNRITSSASRGTQ